VHDRPAGADGAPLPRPATVVVPVRSFEGAKSRLGAVLDAEERRELVERLLRRTVAEALATPGVTEVVVVSPDVEVLALAATLDARPVVQRSRGLNPAIHEARDASAGALRLLVLPADIPAVSAAAIGAVLAAGEAAGSPSVAVAPDRHGRGTNALLLDPPNVIDPAFGGDSRAAHAWLASSAEAAFAEVPGILGLDVDTPDDLLLADAERAETEHAETEHAETEQVETERDETGRVAELHQETLHAR
jgi:2-phospho-L-lactate/phosphoenolpyruvate guanylyltransferase